MEWRGFQSTGCGFDARLRHWILFCHLEVKESEMIDAEFVAAIQELAERGVKPELIDIGGNERMVIAGGAILERFTKDEAFGSTNVVEFSSLLDAAHMLVPKAEIAVIAVSRAGITLACDAHKPHKKANVKLEFALTAAFECLAAWESQARSVSTINKLLRTKLYGTFDDKLITIFKQVEFARAGSTTVAKGAHRDTMGKSVDNAVRSLAGELPEVILFTTPLLQNAPCSPVDLRYYVEVDHDKEQIGIAAIGDFVAEAMRETVSQLIDRLKGELPAALVVAS